MLVLVQSVINDSALGYIINLIHHQWSCYFFIIYHFHLAKLAMYFRKVMESLLEEVGYDVSNSFSTLILLIAPSLTAKLDKRSLHTQCKYRT